MAKQIGGWVPSGITWRVQHPPLFSSGILITENEIPIWLSSCTQIAVYMQPKAILTAPGYGWRLGNQSVEDVHIQLFIQQILLECLLCATHCARMGRHSEHWSR